MSEDESHFSKLFRDLRASENEYVLVTKEEFKKSYRLTEDELKYRMMVVWAVAADRMEEPPFVIVSDELIAFKWRFLMTLERLYQDSASRTIEKVMRETKIPDYVPDDL